MSLVSCVNDQYARDKGLVVKSAAKSFYSMFASESLWGWRIIKVWISL